MRLQRKVKHSSDIDPENGTVQIKYVDISETETVKFDPGKVNMKYIISAEK